MSELDTAPQFGSYDAAIDWFRSRVPLTDSDVRELSARAKERAFWAAGATTASQVESLQDSLTASLRAGESIDDWRKSAAQILTQSTRAHLNTVFRTNVQAAASAARQTQMYKPAILARRPFGLIQTVDDNRRSKICTGLAGTLMPLDDPGWLMRTPPYHYNCRSLIRNITAEQAEKLGGPTGWPAAMPMAGFGRATAMVGRQQVETVDASLRDILEARRIEETIDPITTSPEISIPEPRATADAIRKVGLDKRWRSPDAVKRFVGIDRETFDEGAVSVSADRGAVTIHARNERVSLTRTVRPDGTVFHDSLKIAEPLRGKGIARGMLRTAAAEYVKAGISRVELLADDDGKFVWPKLGFRASPEAVAKQSAKFDLYLEKQGDKPLAAKSMQAIANHPKGETWLKIHAPILYYEITPQELLDRLS